MGHTTFTTRTDCRPKPLEDGLAERIATPALVIDLAACRRNIAAVLARTGGPERWRPHVKTSKVPEVLDLVADAGVRAFKCATTLEARVLAERLTHGGDVLIAHHLFGPALARAAEVAAAQPSVEWSTLVESVDQIDAVPEALGIFIDVDLGMARTGISIDDTNGIVQIARRAGARFRGLHAYDGHRTEDDLNERRDRVHASYDVLVGLCDELHRAGAPPAEVITAGTPAMLAALSHEGIASIDGTVHRVSPGTVVYHDLRSTSQLEDMDAEFAVTVLSRVASLRTDGTFTVDAGSKAITGSGAGCIAQALEHDEAIAGWQSEEHTVFEGASPKRGELLRLVPGHVCPTVDLASHAVLVDDGAFVGVVDVAARGHEVFIAKTAD